MSGRMTGIVLNLVLIVGLATLLLQDWFEILLQGNPGSRIVELNGFDLVFPPSFFSSNDVDLEFYIPVVIRNGVMAMILIILLAAARIVSWKSLIASRIISGFTILAELAAIWMFLRIPDETSATWRQLIQPFYEPVLERVVVFLVIGFVLSIIEMTCNRNWSTIDADQ